jgi:hypothetical protein
MQAPFNIKLTTSRCPCWAAKLTAVLPCCSITHQPSHLVNQSGSQRVDALSCQSHQELGKLGSTITSTFHSAGAFDISSTGRQSERVVVNMRHLCLGVAAAATEGNERHRCLLPSRTVLGTNSTAIPLREKYSHIDQLSSRLRSAPEVGGGGENTLTESCGGPNAGGMMPLSTVGMFSCCFQA